MRHSVRAATRWALALSITIAISLCSGACATSGAGKASRAQMDRAVDRVKPSLVRIKIVEPGYQDGREVKYVATGSGTIITPEGHVLTNHHVAGKAVRIVCTMPNREEVPATLVGTDPATDIAIVKLQPEEPAAYPSVEFADSDQVRVGDEVLAMGSPLGLSQSVTRGVISNNAMIIARIFSNANFNLDGENVGELVRWFGHDAAIFGGNSGGPLVNMEGRIVGVNELSYGLAGAIPGNIARKAAFEIIEKGEVSRAYLGMTFQPLLKSEESREGVLVANVLKNSPAEKAGVKPGDVLLSLGGTRFDARFLEDLPAIHNLIADLPAGQTIQGAFRRGPENLTLEMTPELRQKAMQPEAELRDWGMTAADISMWTRLEMGIDETPGVLVTTTSSGGPCAQAKPSVLPGDVIRKVAGKTIENRAALEAATKEITATSDDPVPTLVEYSRADERLLTLVKVGVADLDDPGKDVHKGWLPMETQVLTRDLAEHLGMAGAKGVRVTRLYRDRPSDFPFHVGDIITHLDGDVIEASEPHDSEVFSILLRQYRVGTEVEFTVVRDAEKQSIPCKLMPSPPRGREMKSFRDLDFGFQVREAAYFDKQDPKYEGVDVEVLAEAVTSGGWASLAGLEVGDVLLEIGGRQAASLAGVESAMEQIHAEKPERVVLKVRRGTQHAYLELEPSW
ncbi:PDZ domain-containing protein [Candidatus Poribacteria bacterium]|nr:PDZ domain-containing protein [Candidatus Poribacteria bacterium]